MPSLTDHHSSHLFKLFLIGDSGTGKTSALACLARKGYNLRILDMDNGLDVLAVALRDDPEAAARVSFETLRDSYKAGPQGPVLRGSPKAYVNAVKLLDNWSDGTKPEEWGDDTILVIDSLTMMGRACFEWAKSLNPSAKDPRQWYFTAQESILNIIANLTSEEFRANVIVISHISYSEMQDGQTKGYPAAIGSALGPKIAVYLNTLAIAETRGSGSNVRRTLRVTPTAVVEAKSPVAPSFNEPLPLENGLATLTDKLKGLS